MVDDTVERFSFVKHPDYADRDHSSGIPQALTEEYIVTLNRNMILAAKMKDRKSAQVKRRNKILVMFLVLTSLFLFLIRLWNNLLYEAYYLQDIETNKANSDRRFHSTIQPLDETSFWTETKARIGKCSGRRKPRLTRAALEWWWVIVFRSIVYRILAILFSVSSLCILWSELTFNVKSPLISIVGLAIDACGLNYAAVEVKAFF
jgi:hypothetical protein